MGYLDGSSVTVDCTLTKKGRELLSLGRSEFNITQFALADDEIDYSLWNPAHPLGSDYYGIIIENMPITEAVPDETQMMKYKLVTLPRNTKYIPTVTLPGYGSTVEISVGGNITIKPDLAQYTGGNNTLGYTAILHNNDIATISSSGNGSQVTPTLARYLGDGQYARSTYVVGKEFKITAKQLLVDKTTTLTFIANETGGRKTIQLTVKKYTQIL